jgi:hypothetical protein
MAGQKFLQHDNAGGIREVEATQTGGMTKWGQLVALDGNGQLAANMMPTGIGADTAQIVASGALAAGDLVNVFDDAGTAKVRKADANSKATEAHGFVLAAVTDGATAEVYFEGTITGLTGLTPGVQYLSNLTAGKSGSNVPNGTGDIVQRVGIATSATTLNFEPGFAIEKSA